VAVAAILLIFVASTRMAPADQPSFSDLAHPHVVSEPKRTLHPNSPNPPPELHSPDNDSLYVAILDFQSEPAAHHCLLKSQWIDKFLARDNVENVEFYSLASWTNEDCHLHSLPVDRPPERMADSSSWLFTESLKLALNRSTSGWFFIVTDAVYIRVDPFFAFFANHAQSLDPFTQKSFFGGCYEKRYFFQLMTPESGVFLSRHFAEELLRLTKVWSVVMDIGIQYDEALAHISDEVGVSIKRNAVEEMLGRAWRNHSDFELMANKSFGNLPVCAVPRSHIYNAPGELGLCLAGVVRLNSVITWAVDDAMDKKMFLERAEEFIEGNPDDLGFYWDLTRPTLCIVRS